MHMSVATMEIRRQAPIRKFQRLIFRILFGDDVKIMLEFVVKTSKISCVLYAFPMYTFVFIKSFINTNYYK